MLPLPTDMEDALLLADWLELVALSSGDLNSSAGDLRNALQLAGFGKAAERFSLDALLEIEDRSRSTGLAYPFTTDNPSVIQAKGSLSDYTPYIFCLCLSYFGWKSTKSEVNPWYVFEDLAASAARSYVQGNAFQFGARMGYKRGQAKPFKQALVELCQELGEGGFRQQRTFNKKDDRVDLVAWRDFSDKRRSKLVIFGQCASGRNWKDKLPSLQPDVFWDQWMSEGKVSPLIRSFYIPFRVPSEEWDIHARSGGILFDRCRIAALAHGADWYDPSAVLAWCRTVFPPLSSQ